MRSWFVAMPGENASCVGCHESVNSGPPSKPSMAMKNASSAITPWNGPARAFSFTREVQPVLDRYCIGCHNGADPARPNFTANRKGARNFNAAYLALMPYVRRPGPESDFHVLTPLDYHVSTSELFQMLRKGHHNVVLDADALSRLTTWVDLNVPDHGTWSEHRAQPLQEQSNLRNEYRKQYAGVTDDPEKYPADAPRPVGFTKPAAETKRAAAPVVAGWPFDAAEAQRRQNSAGLPKEMQLTAGNTKINLVLIPAGEFVMGDPNGAADESPAARVRIEKPFYMSRAEISNEQFREFNQTHDSRLIDNYTKDHVGGGPTVNNPKQPAVRVSWQQAMAYCDWLAARNNNQRCTLPTEAQWEYACRAGAATPMWFGATATDFGKFANLADKNLRGGLRTVIPWIPAVTNVNDSAVVTRDVGGYQQNPWGLNDMNGNAAEWTRSLYLTYPYRDDDGRNKPEPMKNYNQRVARGGSFWDRPHRATSSARRGYEAWQQVFDVGFRVIVEVDNAKLTASR
jgi:formylglycine-generating enzyme required for sulfatase activity